MVHRSAYLSLGFALYAGALKETGDHIARYWNQ
jgi:hypothetical protein